MDVLEISSPKKIILIVTAILLSFCSQAWSSLVINELDYNQPNADNAEFIEIYNNGTAAVNLNSYTLVFINGNDNSIYHTESLSGSGWIDANAYYVACSDPAMVSNCQLTLTATIQNGPADVVALVLDTVVDSVVYAGSAPNNLPSEYIEADPAVADSSQASMGLSRIPNGIDSNNNATDFKISCITPGVANSAVAFLCDFPTSNCGEPASFIHDIQGDGIVLPQRGNAQTIEGVVTGQYTDGEGQRWQFIQQSDSEIDSQPQTSEAIMVLDSGFILVNGDLARISGIVTEVNGITRLESTRLEQICEHNLSVSPTPLKLPNTGASSAQQIESMLVIFNQTLVVTDSYFLGEYGELMLSVADRLFQPTHFAVPGIAAQELALANKHRHIILDDNSAMINPGRIQFPSPEFSLINRLRVGDSITGLVGIINTTTPPYRIQAASDVAVAKLNPRSKPFSTTDKKGLSVASFSLNNFFNGDGKGGGFPTDRGAESFEAYQRQKQKIIAAVVGMDVDIIALTELENDGYDQFSAIVDLVDSINQAQPLVDNHYKFINPVIGQAGTDAIKIGMLYRNNVVTPVGTAAILDSRFDPLFNDSRNRPSLAQRFRDISHGESFIFVANHLKSKGSSCASSGDVDTGDGQGHCNITRTNATKVLVAWLNTTFPDEKILIMGDLNAYAKEDPINMLRDRGFTNLIDSLVGNNAYSYIFKGQAGYLDHALANASLIPHVTDLTIWHINADEPRMLDYQQTSTAEGVDIFAPDPYRSSDHDPVIVQLSFSQTNLKTKSGGSMNLLVLCIIGFYGILATLNRYARTSLT